MSKFSNIKVFGCRNTGTNFLNAILKGSTTLKVLEHGSNEAVNARAQQFPKEIQAFARERLIDQQRAREFPENFGWKHAAVSKDYLEAGPLFLSTLFVFIVRNPFYFLNSLHRRPYNAHYKSWKNKTAFLDTPWLCTARDNLPDLYLETPVQLWNLKTASYRQTSKDIANAIFLRYEDLVARPECLSEAFSKHQIPISEPLKIPQESTKGDTLDFAAYRDKAQNYDPAQDFSAKQLDFILKHLDTELAQELGYVLPVQTGLMSKVGIPGIFGKDR